MSKKLVAVLVLALVLSAVSSVAYAIPFGVPDGEDHPYVGLMVAFIDGVPQWRCSGTLLNPTLFLTAGHCTAGSDHVEIWFDEIVQGNPDYPFTGDVSGTPHAHPNYVGLILPNTSDVGVVVLDEPFVLSEYGTLPGIGALDSLATQRGLQDVTFTVVGYGLQGVKPVYSAERNRFQGTVHLVNLTSSLTDGWNIHLSNNPGLGNGGPGGTCFGDSGGPAFIDDSNVIAGVASFVLNSNCKGAGFNYRVDTAYAQDFIAGFLN
jgi:hypothetical protein